MKLLDDLYYYPWTSFTENNCNTYFIDGEVKTLIDPGHLHLFSHVIDGMAEDGLSLDDVDVVIATHSHPDHFEGSVRFHGKPVRIGMHEEGERYLAEIGPAFYQAVGQKMPRFRVDFHLQEGELHLGSKTFQILYTPGHDPGAICIYWPENKVLITGDVIFKEGVGRTDFPQCSGRQLIQSILRLKDLDVEYLLPGHGDIVTGKREVNRNFAVIESLYFPMMQHS